MNYSQLILHDQSNGPGIRVSLFVSGCDHNCDGCFNTAAMKPSAGQRFITSTMVMIDSALHNKYVSGLSILGGDPLMDYNYPEVLSLCDAMKLTHPTKSIWLWTGWSMEYVRARYPSILEYVDVIVDGKYDKNLPAAPYRGSSNQRIWIKTIEKEFVECPENLLDKLK